MFAVVLALLAAVLAGDVVVIKQGQLKGHRLTTRKGREISAFQGIPYAKPPVGKLRFQVGCADVREFMSAHGQPSFSGNIDKGSIYSIYYRNQLHIISYI
jgi:hypothetical protein